MITPGFCVVICLGLHFHGKRLHGDPQSTLMCTGVLTTTFKFRISVKHLDVDWMGAVKNPYIPKLRAYDCLVCIVNLPPD